VGGVGSGKSTLAAWVADHRRLVVIDSDGIGHEALKQTHVKQQLRDRFGGSIFDEEGAVKRSELGRLVFGPSAEHQRAQRDLEHFVHPEIRKELVRRIARAQGEGSMEAVLLDAAVLLEAGWNTLCDTIVFVDTPHERRLERVIANRGWTEEVFRARESSQWPLEKKRSASDHIVINSGTVAQAGGRLERILEQVRSRQN
jgi:dephospho-CoA kinase